MESLGSFQTAKRRAQKLQASQPRAICAHYDRARRKIVISLSTRIEVSFSPQDAEGLQDVSVAKLNPIEISPSGFGLYFPKLDADFYLPALLEGFLGSRQWLASRLGAAGGSSRSVAKKLAAKVNGRLGGRPRGQARSATAVGRRARTKS